MKNIITLVILLVITPKVMCQTYKIENRHLARILQVTDGRLSTQSIVNKQAKTTLRPISCDEFAIRFSLPGSKDSADCYVSAKDFAVVSVSPYSNPQCPKSKGYRFRLQGKQHGLSEASEADFRPGHPAETDRRGSHRLRRCTPKLHHQEDHRTRQRTMEAGTGTSLPTD